MKRIRMTMFLTLIGCLAFAMAQPVAAEEKVMDPSTMNEQAPDVFRVTFATSKGDFVIEVHRDWAPLGADRFYNLVSNGYLDDARFFRAIANFMVQFGLNADPAITSVWKNARIQDDPVKETNSKGRITFAMAGPNTRTTQLFINLVDNARLDGSGFAPFGEVIEGMEIVEQLYTGYGEGAPSGRGPSQGKIMAEGNAYLTESFPELDFIKSTTVSAVESASK